MTIPTSVLTKMATLGLSAEQAEVVASMLGEVEAATHAEVAAVGDAAKEKARARWHRWKESHSVNVSKRLPTAANNSRGGVAPVEDKLLTTEIEPQVKKEGDALTREALETYTAMATSAGLAVPRVVTSGRRTRLQAVIREHGLPAFLEAVAKVGASSFCRGENERGWKADLDFILQAKSFPKILEGHYDNRAPMARGSPNGRPIDQLINSISARMDQANASTTTEIEGHPAAPLRLSARQW